MVCSDHCQKKVYQVGPWSSLLNTVLDFALRIRNILIVNLHFMPCTIHHWVRGIESYKGGVFYFSLQCCRFLPCIF